MPYKDPERRRAWYQAHRKQDNARSRRNQRRRKREARALRKAGPPEVVTCAAPGCTGTFVKRYRRGRLRRYCRKHQKAYFVRWYRKTHAPAMIRAAVRMLSAQVRKRLARRAQKAT